MVGKALFGVIPVALFLTGCVAPVEVLPGWDQALADGQIVTVYDQTLSTMVLELQNHRFVLATHSTPLAVWLYRLGFNTLGLGLLLGSWRFRHSLGWPVFGLNLGVVVLLVWVAGLSFDRRVEIDFSQRTVVEERAWFYGLWDTSEVVGQLNKDFERAQRQNDCVTRFESDLVECTESVVLVGASEFEILSVPQALLDVGKTSIHQREFIEKLTAFINARWPASLP